MKRTGAATLLECLRQEGVRYVFGNPGTTEVAILDALVDVPDVEYILTLHESVAAAMADGYARAGGGIGFVNVHTALGLSNAIGGLYGCHVDGIPVVVTISNKDSRILGRGVFSEVDDVTGMVRQFTKWSWQVMRPDRIAEDVTRAFKIAATPPTGPVFLSVPEDFLAAKGDWRVPPSQRSGSQGGPCPGSEELRRASQLLLSARNPVMVAGNEIARAGALPQAVELAEFLGIPVLTEGRQSLAYLNFPPDHPLYREGFETSSEYVRGADLILAAGCQLFVQSAYSEMDDVLQDTQIIHFHPNPAVIGKLYPVEVAVVTDVKAGLAGLLEELKASAPAERLPGLRERFDRMKAESRERERAREKDLECVWGRSPIRVAQLAREMQQVAARDAIIVDDAIRSSRPLLKYYKFSEPNTYYRSPAGYLGWGLPAALGVKLAQPQRQVIAFVGDGGFVMSNQALWTAARYQIPITVVVCNNRQYKAVRDGAVRFKGRAAETGHFIGSSIDSPAPDLARLAESLGVAGHTVRAPSEIGSVLEEALHSGKPSVVDVQIEQ